MSTINTEYQDIYYQIYDGQNLANVWTIKRNVNDPAITNVADLLSRIHSGSRRLQHCDAQDLRLYERGTTAEDYKSNQDMQMLEIDLPLGDPRIQQATKAKPLLVVVFISSATPLPASTANNMTTIQEGKHDNTMIFILSV
jgi:hypothetical protein